MHQLQSVFFLKIVWRSVENTGWILFNRKPSEFPKNSIWCLTGWISQQNQLPCTYVNLSIKTLGKREDSESYNQESYNLIIDYMILYRLIGYQTKAPKSNATWDLLTLFKPQTSSSSLQLNNYEFFPLRVTLQRKICSQNGRKIPKIPNYSSSEC